MTTPNEEPAWKQRAVERSTRAAKVRAEQRVDRFLGAAQKIMIKKGSTDFTVQEVVDASRQSLRSFYQHFSGKHELLLALFEDALRRAAEQINEAASGQRDPLDRIRVAAELLFELSRPDPSVQRPLFTDFAPQLLISHPAEVKAAHAPLMDVFADLLTQAEEAGELRPGLNPRRTAAMTMQTIMFIAQANGSSDDETVRPITAQEAWEFCSHGFAVGR